MLSWGLILLIYVYTASLGIWHTVPFSLLYEGEMAWSMPAAQWGTRHPVAEALNYNTPCWLSAQPCSVLRIGEHPSTWVSESSRWYLGFCIKEAVDRKVINSALRGLWACRAQSARADGIPHTPHQPCSARTSWRWWIGLFTQPHIGQLCCEPANVCAMRLNHGGFAAWPRPASLKALTFAGLPVWVRVRFGHQVSQRSQMPLHTLLLVPLSAEAWKRQKLAVSAWGSEPLLFSQADDATTLLSPLKTFNLLASIYSPGVNIK